MVRMMRMMMVVVVVVVVMMMMLVMMMMMMMRMNRRTIPLPNPGKRKDAVCSVCCMCCMLCCMLNAVYHLEHIPVTNSATPSPRIDHVCCMLFWAPVLQ